MNPLAVFILIILYVVGALVSLALVLQATRHPDLDGKGSLTGHINLDALLVVIWPVVAVLVVAFITLRGTWRFITGDLK